MNKFYLEMLQGMRKNEKEMMIELKISYVKALDEIYKAIAREAAEDIVEGSETHMKVQRLFTLQSQVESALENLYDSNLHKISDYGQDIYEERYYRTFYQIENELKINLNFSMLNETKIEAAVNYPIEGMRLSERIVGKNLNNTKKAIKEKLVQAAITGEGYNEMAEKIAHELGISYNAAKRIVRTEGGRISSFANMEAIKETERLGIEVKKQWLATLDDRTRDAHADLDGQIVGTDEEFEMMGYAAPAPHMWGIPEMDINCRCDVITIVEGIGPDARRDNITDDFIEYQSYEEWYDDKVIY